MGSAGAKAMAIIQGRADIYAHAGGQYQWDSAAPVAVAAAAGLHVSRHRRLARSSTTTPSGRFPICSSAGPNMPTRSSRSCVRPR